MDYNAGKICKISMQFMTLNLTLGQNHETPSGHKQSLGKMRTFNDSA